MTHSVRRRKKPLWRRIRHQFKPLWRRYGPIFVSIVLGLFTAFYVMPSLLRFFSGED